MECKEWKVERRREREREIHIEIRGIRKERYTQIDKDRYIKMEIHRRTYMIDKT